MNKVVLPPLPQHHSEDWWTDASEPPCRFLANRLYTERQLRARDLEVARVVLEGAAFHLRGADKHLTDLQISDQIRALEVRHHE